ncbi:MAG: hypothetical protein Fur0043_15580 [Anaerolineales bacterium]
MFDVGSLQLPVVLLVEPEQEEMALAALENVWATDYVTKTQAGYARLAAVLRTAVVRHLLPSRSRRWEFLYTWARDRGAFVLLDQDGKLVFKDEEAFAELGYSREEVTALKPIDLVHPHDRAQILPLFQELIATPGMEKEVRLRFLQKDGAWHWYQATVKNLLEDAAVQGVLIHYWDLTKRKQDEVQQDALYRIAQASLAGGSLEDLFQSVHVIISELMPANNFFVALYDARSNSLSYPYFVDERDQPPDGLIPLDEKSLTGYVIRTANSLLCDLPRFAQLEAEGSVELLGPQSLIWLGVPLQVEGQVIGAMVVQHYTDVSAYGPREMRMLEFVSSHVASAVQRRQAEITLRQSEERLRSLFENATVGIYRTTLDGRLLFANPAILRMTGYESSYDLTKIDVNSAYENLSDREYFLSLLQEKGEVRGLEATWRRTDGTKLFVRESARLVRDERTGELYCEGIVEDITDRIRFEAALREKVAALETLAEIDREILQENDPQALVQLVCRRAAGLFKAPKACVISVAGSQMNVLASYGFEDEPGLREELFEIVTPRLFQRFISFIVCDLKEKNFSAIMPVTRKRENIRAMLADAFNGREDFRAILMICDIQPRRWTEDDVQLVKFLARQIALSYEKTRLLASAETRARNFETLYYVSQDLASHQQTHVVLESVVRAAVRLLGTQSSFIYLYDEERNELRLTVSYGADIPSGFRVQMGQGLAGRVAQTRKPGRVKNYSSWRYRLRALDDLHFSAVLSVPMLYGGHLVGVLDVSEIGSSRREFSDEEERLLSLFASQAASAVYNAHLFEQSQKRSEELNRLYRALGILISSVSSTRENLCQKIAEIVSSEFELANCTLWLVEKESSLLERCGVALSSAEMPNYAMLTLDGRGLIPKAIRTATFINCGDVSQDPDYVKGWQQARSEMVIPLITESGVIGAIDLQSADQNAFRQEDERLMRLFALRVAAMLEHVQLVEQTQERVKRLEALHAIEAAVASSVDLRITIHTLLDQVISRLSVDAADILLLDSHLQTLRYAAGRGAVHFYPEDKIQYLGAGIAGRAALDHEIVFVALQTQTELASPFPDWAAREGFLCQYAVPLIAKGQVKGVLELFYRRLVRPDPEWLEFLETLARQAAVAIEGISLLEQFQNTLLEQKIMLDSGIEVWMQVLEQRGFEPVGHCHRTAELSILFFQRLGFGEVEYGNIYRGALLHDIGKLLMPDSLLLNPDPLTEEEWKWVQRHPELGRDLLKRIFPFEADLEIPYFHHENWDGSGYPQGLKGEHIPIAARVFRLVEVWDLLQVDLPYRQKRSRDETISFIREQAGKLFDPHLVQFFLNLLAEGDL